MVCGLGMKGWIGGGREREMRLKMIDGSEWPFAFVFSSVGYKDYCFFFSSLLLYLSILYSLLMGTIKPKKKGFYFPFER